MSRGPLLAVPNVSEGRDGDLIDELALVIRSTKAKLLDVHSDPDHNRSVFTIAAAPGTLSDATLELARAALARVDMTKHDGVHPHVGAVDVAPIVYLDERDAGAASAEALVLADRLGHELRVPVFLYGALGGGRTRAELRRGGARALAERIEAGDLRPDFGPRRLHPTAGATLVAARPPLVAFNVALAPPATVQDAKDIAAQIRESTADGLPGVRAIGLWLERRGVAQVSVNVEDHRATSLAQIVEAIEQRAGILETEIVGLAPAAAFRQFPGHVAVRGRATLEDALSGRDASNPLGA